MPCDARAPACAERLERGFFRGEAHGVMHRRIDAAAIAVSLFRFGKDALAETRRALDRLPHAGDFDDVQANRDNHDG